jgi:hypothetical protein
MAWLYVGDGLHNICMQLTALSVTALASVARTPGASPGQGQGRASLCAAADANR